MAMENKRIIQLSTERTTLGDDDYTIVDSDTNGTAKYRLSRLKETDTTLSVSGMAADAAATGQAINAETQARTQAVAAETQARAAADTALGNDVQDLKSALNDVYSQKISDTYTVAANKWFKFNIVTGRKYIYKNTSTTAGQAVYTEPSNGSYANIEQVGGGTIIAGSTVIFTPTQDAPYIMVYCNGTGSFEFGAFDSFEKVNNDISSLATQEITDAKNTNSYSNDLLVSLINDNLEIPLSFVWEENGFNVNTGVDWINPYSARMANSIIGKKGVILKCTNLSATSVSLCIWNNLGVFQGNYAITSAGQTFVLEDDYIYRAWIYGSNSAPVDRNNIDSYISAVFINQMSDKLPSYYDSYMPSKIEEVKEKSAYVQGITFPFITDVHLQFNAMNAGKMIKMIDKETNAVPFVVFGGDVPKPIDTASNVIAYADQWNEYMDTWGKHKTIQVHGNHDYMCALDNALTNLWYADLSVVFEYIGQNDYYHISRPPKALYGAINIPSQNVKIIIADNFDSSYDFDNDTWNGGAGMSNEQLKWIANDVLTDSNSDVLFISHIPTLESMSVQAEAQALKPFDDLIKAAKNKTTYTVDGETYNFSSRTGDVIAELAGHMHTDADGTDDNVLYIGVTCDSYSDADSSVTRTLGTTSEQAFDVVCIDTFNKTINLVRFGGGSSRSYTY